jgi:phosphatidate phosphatase APP1
MHATWSNTKNEDKIIIKLAHNLDSKIYDSKLTLKTYISNDWNTAQVKQDGKTQTVKANKDGKGNFILYEAKPNAGAIEISKSA